MKELLVCAVSVLVGGLLGIAMISDNATYEVGFEFLVPCQMHESHTLTIVSCIPTYMYEVSDETGNTDHILEEELTAWLPNEESR